MTLYNPLSIFYSMRFLEYSQENGVELEMYEKDNMKQNKIKAKSSEYLI